MSDESSARPSRRALLAAMMSAAVASVAQGLGRPVPADAGVNYVKLGQGNPATVATSVSISLRPNDALVGAPAPFTASCSTR